MIGCYMKGERTYSRVCVCISRQRPNPLHPPTRHLGWESEEKLFDRCSFYYNQNIPRNQMLEVINMSQKITCKGPYPGPPHHMHPFNYLRVWNDIQSCLTWLHWLHEAPPSLYLPLFSSILLPWINYHLIRKPCSEQNFSTNHCSYNARGQVTDERNSLVYSFNCVN